VTRDQAGGLAAWAPFAVGAAVLLALAGCGGEAPPIQPQAPQVQEVPGMSSADFTPVETYCLAPGLRVFVSKDGHGRRIFDVENMTGYPVNAGPYGCPG
jgi:hypothetical protein